MTGVSRADLAAAMRAARLPDTALAVAPHPDDGWPCLRLEATVAEYGALLVALARQQPAVPGLAAFVDRVRLQHDAAGDTVFWLAGAVAGSTATA